MEQNQAQTQARPIASWTTGRVARLLFGAFSLAPLGVVLFDTLLLLLEIFWHSRFPKFDLLAHDIAVAVLIAYLWVGIPSILYSLLMEFVINPFCKTRRQAVLLSALAGAFAGLPAAIPFALFPAAIPFALLGAVVGTLIGRILRWMYVRGN